jgi:hypothetical protein
MPAPQAPILKQLVRAKFTSFQIKVPLDWRNPQGEGANQYPGAFKDNEHTVAPNAPLFLPQTFNKYHVDVQRQHNKDYGEFMDAISEAICFAWQQWQTSATLVGVIINGPAATVGNVVGPPWAPLIITKAQELLAPMSRYTLAYVNAVANTLSTAWMTYTTSIKVPGLPWYPAFLMCPSPVAPPTPNVPASLAMLTQVPAPLAPALLAQQMWAMLGMPREPFGQKMFEAIADGFDKVFQIWSKSTMIQNVIGTGPVPSFAPPISPAGPVVMGVGTMPPGGFV